MSMLKALVSVILSFINIAAFAQDSSVTEQQAAKDAIIIQKIRSIKLSKFQGKTIRQLLQNDTIKLYSNYGFTDEPPGKLQSLNLTYPDGLVLLVYPYEKHGQVVQFSMSASFDFEALKKTKIRKLVLVAEPTGSTSQF